MRLGDLKLSVTGMPNDKRLFMRQDTEKFYPLTKWQLTAKQLILQAELDQTNVLELQDILRFPDEIEVVGVDVNQQVFYIYGYQVRGDQLILA